MSWRIFMMGLADGRAASNPVARLAWRHQRSPAQLGMLCAAMLFVCGVTWYGKSLLAVRGELLAYVLVRWALADFFWLWMCADHLISTVMRVRRSGAWDEWRLTALTPTELIAGFFRPALVFLLAGLTVHSLADWLIPYGMGGGLRSSPALFSHGLLDWGLWRTALTLALWINGAATLMAASALALRTALACAPSEVHGQWFRMLVAGGVAMASADAIGLVAGGGIGLLLYWGASALQEREVLAIGAGLTIAVFISAWRKVDAVALPVWRELVGGRIPAREE